MRLGLLTAFASAALVATTAQAQTTLRWKFQKGETLNYELVQKSSSKISVNNQNIEIQSNQTIDTTWVVKDVSSDGQADVNQKFDRIRINMEAPNAKLEFDSKDGKLPEGQLGKMLGPVLQALAGAEISFKMNARGEVTDVKLPEQLVNAIKQMPGAGQGQAGMFSEDGIKKSIQQSTLPLPEEPLTPGKTWHQKTEVPTPPLGTMVIDNSYTFLGPDPQSPDKLERIELGVVTSIKPSEGSQIQVKLKSQDAKGMFLFDNKKGYLNQTSLNQKLELVLTANGMDVTQTQESSVTMRLVKGS